MDPVALSKDTWLSERELCESCIKATHKNNLDANMYMTYMNMYMKI